MNQAVLASPMSMRSSGLRALHGAARLWFVAAVAGQWFFAMYVALFYGGAAATGDVERVNDVLPGGLIDGDTFGNAMAALHLALALVVLVGGPLQFIGALRERAPRVHRWNGRVYLVTAMLAALAGVYMVLTRGTVGDLSMHVAISFNGFLILSFAIAAWYHARVRDFAAHRRWVLRLFLVVSGVWFFRVGLMFWIAINGEPVGFDPKTFTGPALTILAFAQTLLPLAVLELYLHAERRGSAGARFATGALLVMLTLAMSLGIFVAANVMWLPRLGGV